MTGSPHADRPAPPRRPCPARPTAVYVAVVAEADGHVERDGVHKATLWTCLLRPALCTHRLLGELSGGAARHYHHRDG